MPYSLSSKNLPSYVANKAEPIRKKWIAIFNAIYKKEGEELAFATANNWLKKQKKTLVKRSILSFTIEQENETLLKRSDDGEDYVTFILAGSKKHPDGIYYDNNVLNDLAKQINERGIVGDIDHIEFDRLRESGLSDEAIQSLLQSKRGIAKGLRALVKDGNLYVRAITDKRYSSVIRKSKGVSLEAMTTMDDTDSKVTSARLLGFTFNVNTTPADPSAKILA